MRRHTANTRRPWVPRTGAAPPPRRSATRSPSPPLPSACSLRGRRSLCRRGATARCLRQPSRSAPSRPDLGTARRTPRIVRTRSSCTPASGRLEKTGSRASKNGDSMNGKGLRSPNRGKTQRSVDVDRLGRPASCKAGTGRRGTNSPDTCLTSSASSTFLGACPAGRLLIQITCVPSGSMRRRRGGHRATRSTPIQVHSP